jgi:hypothetical protein
MYANARGIVTAACNLGDSERTGPGFELVRGGPEDDNGKVERAMVYLGASAYKTNVRRE